MLKMGKTILKNLFSAPPTRKYPFVKREPFKSARGRIRVDIDKCILCGICSKQCPTGAITVDKDKNLWSVDPFKCITCGYCTEKCPKGSISFEQEYTNPGVEKGVRESIKENKQEEKTDESK